MIRAGWITGTALFLAACGSNESGGQSTDTGDQVETANASEPPASFAQCKVCHTVEKDGNNGVGPNLWNVAGEAAAQKAGFAYSLAMKNGSLIWDDATLGSYLESPLKAVPGTKMAFAGVRDQTQRAEIIAYLKMLKE